MLDIIMAWSINHEVWSGESHELNMEKKLNLGHFHTQKKSSLILDQFQVDGNQPISEQKMVASQVMKSSWFLCKNGPM